MTLADEIESKVEIDYKDIPNFPLTTVEGHAGKFVYGLLGNKSACHEGTISPLRGYDVSQIVFPIRTFKVLGINNLIVTNASGGINKAFKPGI